MQGQTFVVRKFIQIIKVFHSSYMLNIDEIPL